MHKHLLLLFTKLAFPSYSLAELVRKSGFLAQVSGVGLKKKKKTNPAESPSPLLPVFSRAARHCSPGTWLGCAFLPAPARLSGGTATGATTVAVRWRALPISPLNFLFNQVCFLKFFSPDLCKAMPIPTTQALR